MTVTRISRQLRVCGLVAIGVIVGVGLSAGRSVQAERRIAPEPVAQPEQPVRWQDARLLAEVLELVRKDYVDARTDRELIEAAIRGLIGGLDPHSSFLDASQLNEIRISTAGEYSGVGIEVTLESGVVSVVNPIEGGPAALAGVLAGDTILAVDEVPVSADNLDDTIDRMRGKPGSTVKITIARREAPQPIEFTLARANVHVRSVKQSMLDEGIGYVAISHFSETTTLDVQKAIASLSRDCPLQGLVLDLRDNPGGLLEAGIGVADLFLDDGVIVTAEGRAADARFAMDAQPGDEIDGAPLVVLVNGASASASEIVAGALKDHGRGKIVGQQTYGKGSVQTVMPLSDGHAIKLTTSRYFTPSGVSIHKIGITPDLIVPSADDRVADAAAHGGDATAAVADPELAVALDLLRVPAAADSSAAPIRQSRLQ